MNIIREDDFIDESTMQDLEEYVYSYPYDEELRPIIDSDAFVVSLQGYKNSPMIGGNASCNLYSPVSVCMFICGSVIPCPVSPVLELFYRPLVLTIIAVAERQLEHKGGK